MIRNLFVLIYIFLVGQLNAQNNSIADLSFYGDIIANAGDAENRKRAHDAFYPMFEELIRSNGSYDLPIENIRWLSIKTSEDNSFRIYTWQLKLTEDEYEYFGFIHQADGNVHELKVSGAAESDLEYETYDAENWPGALYYNIKPFGKTEDGTYLLFGFNGNDHFNHRKLVDVLSWENGKPVFGKEVFRKSDKSERADIKTRLVLEYSADANVTVNFNPALDMIVHEHLINRMGRIPGQGPTMLPDGSYVGYKYDSGYWNYVDKLYNQVSETAPRPFPVFKDENKTKKK